MTVLDMGAGGGYSTELMARAVGPERQGLRPGFRDTNARAKERFEARMKTDAMKNVVALARPFDDPLPADVGHLDLITFFFFYHDTTYMAVDRAAMNKKLFARAQARRLPRSSPTIRPSPAPAPRSARPCTGSRRARSGARSRRPASSSSASADFLRHPEDPRDERIFQPKVPVDEFVLKFQKPN